MRSDVGGPYPTDNEHHEADRSSSLLSGFGCILGSFRVVLRAMFVQRISHLTLITFLSVFCSNAVFAQEVRLISKTDGTELVGDIVSATIDELEIVTGGEYVSVQRRFFDCIGSACPDVDEDSYRIMLASEYDIASKFFTHAIQQFAANESATLFYDPPNFSLHDPNDELVSRFGIDTFAGTRLFAMLTRGVVDIIVTEERYNPQIAKEVAESFQTGPIASVAHEREIAAIGIFVVVNDANSVSSITLEELDGILSGEIDNWQDVGGADAPINLFRAKRGGLISRILDGHLPGIREAQLLQPHLEFAIETDVVRAVSANVSAMGIVIWPQIENVRSLLIEDNCGVVRPVNAFSVKSLESPLSSRLFMYSTLYKSPTVVDFLSLLNQDDLSDMIDSAGLVDLAVVSSARPQEIEMMQGARADINDPYVSSFLDTHILETEGKKKLSSHIFFAPNSASLDSAAEQQLNRVISYLRQSGSTQLLIAGYTDDRQDFDTALSLSEQRAYEVLNVLNERFPADLIDRIQASTFGFGPLNPLACNDAAEGRSRNNRVAFWIN